MNIPSQYLPVMPYLIVNDSIAFLDFVKNVFGATEQLLSKNQDGTIMHGEIRIHDAVIMFSQASENWASKPAGMFIYVDNVDKVHEAALQNATVSLMSAEKKEYGYTSGFEDPNGNQWWLVECQTTDSI